MEIDYEECEEIYVIGSTFKGEWRKLAKCLEHWFYTEQEAIKFLDTIEEDIRPYYGVFKMTVYLSDIKKVFQYPQKV